NPAVGAPPGIELSQNSAVLALGCNRRYARGMRTTIVTTSWDDGHHADLRVADRLAAHALKGTFYVALNHPGNKDIGDDEIRTLQRMGMEVGSHTLTHRL